MLEIPIPFIAIITLNRFDIRLKIVVYTINPDKMEFFQLMAFEKLI